MSTFEFREHLGQATVTPELNTPEASEPDPLPQLTRRNFIQGAFALAAGAILTSCGSDGEDRIYNNDPASSPGGNPNLSQQNGYDTDRSKEDEAAQIGRVSLAVMKEGLAAVSQRGNHRIVSHYRHLTTWSLGPAKQQSDNRVPTLNFDCLRGALTSEIASLPQLGDHGAADADPDESDQAESAKPTRITVTMQLEPTVAPKNVYLSDVAHWVRQGLLKPVSISYANGEDLGGANVYYNTPEDPASGISKVAADNIPTDVDDEIDYSLRQAQAVLDQLKR